jgi:hypothetical protein
MPNSWVLSAQVHKDSGRQVPNIKTSFSFPANYSWIWVYRYESFYFIILHIMFLYRPIESDAVTSRLQIRCRNRNVLVPIFVGICIVGLILSRIGKSYVVVVFATVGSADHLIDCLSRRYEVVLVGFRSPRAGIGAGTLRWMNRVSCLRSRLISVLRWATLFLPVLSSIFKD